MTALFKNKRAFIPIAAIIPLVLAIVIIIGLIAFLASPTMRFTIIGIAIGVGTFIYVLPAVLRGDVTKQKIAIVLGLFVFAGIFIFSSGLLQEQLTGSYYSAPTFGYLKCEQYGAKQNSQTFVLSQNINTISCGQVGPTDSCIISINTADEGTWSTQRRVKYRETGSSSWIILSEFYPTYENTIVLSQFIPTKTYEVQYEAATITGWKQATIDASYVIQYQPYVIMDHNLFSITNGQPITTKGTQASCDIPQNKLSQVITSATFTIPGKSSEYKLGVPGRLQINEAYTYFSGWISKPSFNTGTKEPNAYCMKGSYGGGKEGKLYQIETITTTGGTYKIVDWAGADAIKEVYCCDGVTKTDYICENNVWVSTAQAECSITSPCGTTWQRDTTVPISQKQVYYYKCDYNTGKCTSKQTKTVECVDNTQCGTGNICVNFECRESCVDCGGVEGGNTKAACEEKAEKSPWLGYEWVIVTKQPNILQKIFTLGLAKEEITEYCKPVFLLYYIWGAVGICIVTAFYFLLKPTKRRKK